MGPRLSRTSAPPASRSPSSAPAPSRRPRFGRGSAQPRRTVPAGSVISEVTARKEHSDHDMRRKRPPALSFLLRMSTLRRGARVLSLLALDFVGVALAIFTALILKAAVRDQVNVTSALHETERILAFVYLLT